MTSFVSADKQKIMSIGILGGGVWGSALARILSQNKVVIYARDINIVNSINDHNIKDIDQIIERAKFQMFNLNLRKKDNKYKIDNDELETFKDKIFKPLNVSSKILLWDQYIPISLAKIDKKTKQMTKNRYYHDYCNKYS